MHYLIEIFDVPASRQVLENGRNFTNYRALVPSAIFVFVSSFPWVTSLPKGGHVIIRRDNKMADPGWIQMTSEAND